MRIEVNSVNEFCKLFRMNVLIMTLKEVEELTGVKVPTLSSFENGRSTNIKHLNLYYSLGNEEQREYFKNNIPYEYRGVIVW